MLPGFVGESPNGFGEEPRMKMKRPLRPLTASVGPDDGLTAGQMLSCIETEHSRLACATPSRRYMPNAYIVRLNSWKCRNRRARDGRTSCRGFV